MDGLCRMQDGIRTVWASAENWKGEKGGGGKLRSGRKGSPAFALKSGESKTLAAVQGQSGMVRRVWMTISERTPQMLRGLKIEVFWDGAEKPAVSAPVGDFFCLGLGRFTPIQNALFSSPEGRSFNCFAPMPFRTGMKIVLTNESGTDMPWIFYEVDYTLGDVHDESMLYFHATWRRENPTTLQKDFEILPLVSGKGRYIGTCLSVIPDQKKYLKSWWGEGEAKIYLDGDRDFPSLCGTGTEDYVGSAWGQGQYTHQYFGCNISDFENFQFAFYRLHIPDPVWFEQDCRVTMQQLGGLALAGVENFTKTGETYYIESEGRMVPIPLDRLMSPDVKHHPCTPEDFLLPIDQAVAANFWLVERQDDWAACAWFYLDRAENGLAPLAPAKERMAGVGVPAPAAGK